MSCLSGLGRILLVVVNIVFMLLGAALAIVGLILRFGEAVYGPILDKGKTLLKQVLDDTKIGTYAVDEVDLGEVMQSLAIGLILGGLVLLGISFLGCCGACCKYDIILWLYAIVLIVILVLEFVAIGLLYGKPNLVKDNVKKSIKDYKGLASAEPLSVGWNIIMIQFKCCGVESYQDFSESPDWNKSPGSSGVTLITPVACCKTLPAGNTAGEFACATGTFDASLNNGETGCYEALWNKSFNNKSIAVPVLIICGIIQLAFIIFAIYIAKSDNNSVSPI